jgi:hypothetical protein
MGGGYSPDIKTIIEAHANTYRVAKTYSKNRKLEPITFNSDSISLLQELIALSFSVL